MKTVTLIVFSFVFTLLGLAGGYFATRPKSAEAAPPARPTAPPEDGPPKPKLSPQALKNLGVTLAEARQKRSCATAKFPERSSNFPPR